MSKITVEFLGDTSRLTRSFDTAGTSAAKFETSLSSVAKAGIAAGAGFLAAQMSIGALEGSVTSIIDTYGKFETQTRAMDAAVGAHGGGILALTATLEANRAEYQSWGLSLAEVRPAVTKLTEAGVAQADIFRMLPAIADLARAKNLDLVSAADLVSKAVNGQARGLLDLGIKLPTATFALNDMGTVSLSAADKANRLTAVLDAVGRAAGGQRLAVDENAKATAGLGNSWERLTTKVGPGLEAVLNTVVGALANTADAVSHLADVGNEAGTPMMGYRGHLYEVAGAAKDAAGWLDAATLATRGLEAAESSGWSGASQKADIGTPDKQIRPQLRPLQASAVPIPAIKEASGGVSSLSAQATAAAAKMKSAFSDAFDTAKSHVLAMYDAMHSRNLKAIEDARLAGDAAITEQQRAIQAPVTAAQAALNERYASEQLASLQKAVQDAMTGGDPYAIQQAQQALTDYMDQANVDRMQQQATAKIDELDLEKQANDEKAKLQTTAENDRYDAQVAAYTKEMAFLDKHLGDTKKAYAKSYADLAKLYRDYLAATGKSLTPSEMAAYQRLVDAGKTLEKREAGGPVSAGVPYIVGEKHPEVFIPNQSGRIEPGMGGGHTFVFSPTIHVATENPEAFARRSVQAFRRELTRQHISLG